MESINIMLEHQCHLFIAVLCDLPKKHIVPFVSSLPLINYTYAELYKHLRLPDTCFFVVFYTKYSITVAAEGILKQGSKPQEISGMCVHCCVGVYTCSTTICSLYCYPMQLDTITTILLRLRYAVPALCHTSEHSASIVRLQM